MKTERVAIADLIEDPANVRRHAEKNLRAIKGSLKRFGQQKPIVVDGRGVVIAGNGTLAAARAIGWVDIDVVRTTLVGAEAVAFAIADNRSGELADWDNDGLSKALAALDADGWDLPDLGWDEGDWDKPKAPVGEGLGDADEVPKKAPARVQRGQIWRLGSHRLLCGDATNAEEVAKLMAGEEADMLFTDPPYGIGYEYASHDDSDANANAQLVAKVFALHSCGKVWTPGLMNLARDIERFGKTKVAVWYKKFAMAGNGIGGASTWEPVLILSPQAKGLNNDVIEIKTDREEVGGVSLRDLHSCPKLVALYETLINALAAPNARVREPFCGSGTTLIACERSARRCFATEIDPHYCDVIIARWEQYTGRTAMLDGLETDF